MDDAELREQLSDFTYTKKVDTPDGWEWKKLVDLDEVLLLIKARDAAIRIDELELLKLEYHNNIVSDDRMDMEIDERLAVLRPESDLGRPTPEGIFRPSREEDFDE